jgi:hypothetical protein
VAAAVIEEVGRQQGHGVESSAAQRAVREAMWYPEYVSYL